MGEDDAAGDFLGGRLAQELAHDLEAEIQGCAGAAASSHELIDDDRVLVGYRPTGSNRLNEGGVRGRVATVEDTQFGQDRGGCADGGDRLARVRAAQDLGLYGGSSLQSQGAGHTSGQEKHGVGR